MTVAFSFAGMDATTSPEGGNTNSITVSDEVTSRTNRCGEASRTAAPARRQQAETHPPSRMSGIRKFGLTTAVLGLLSALFCLCRGYQADLPTPQPIEQCQPLDRLLVDAPPTALEVDYTASATLDLAEPRPQTHRLLSIRAMEIWPDGTVDDINVRTVQPVQWCEAVGARVGAQVPMPVDLVEMGLPPSLQGKVLDIEPCPEPKPGKGRLILTTINHLNRDVIELELRQPRGQFETLRPTGTHKFYSVTRKAWLSAADLRPGEQLDGAGGLVTVASITPIPGTHRVYNLTVQGEHLYRVAHSGVLVHNMKCAPKRITGEALAKMREQFNAAKPQAWMDEAAKNAHKYSPEQLARMRKGQAPIGADGFSMEIHHKTPLAEGGINTFDNFAFLTRTDHRLGPNYKRNHPNLP